MVGLGQWAAIFFLMWRTAVSLASDIDLNAEKRELLLAEGKSWEVTAAESSR
jgi:hypothetical protein